MIYSATSHLYVHVPFCRAKCRYCDFNSYAGIDYLIPPYVDALVREVELRASGASSRIETVYLGGGTPSLLAPGDVARILEAFRRCIGIEPDAEVTLEANPGTVARERLVALREAGINRLSIGVQSFDDRALEMLGRIHSADQAREAYQMARQAGFDNVSLDLMYGLPGQTPGEWAADLATAVELRPEHLSLYCLTVEEDTPLGESLAKEELVFPDPDLAADMYLLAEDRLEAAGYEHYEISNWARPGFRCRHNVSCWKNETYLGFGAGAHSYAEGIRFSNVRRPEDYIRRLSEPDHANELGPAVDEATPISRGLEMAEAMILGLRLVGGVSLNSFKDRFGVELADVYGRQVAEAMSLGLLQQVDGALSLTRRGRLLGNEVFLRFLSV